MGLETLSRCPHLQRDFLRQVENELRFAEQDHTELINGHDAAWYKLCRR